MFVRNWKKTDKAPVLQMAILLLNLLAVECVGSSIFSFVGFMIVDFKIVDVERAAGYYAGFVAGDLLAIANWASFKLS
jgi:hypothetical protein